MVFVGGVIQAVLTVIILQDVLSAPMEKLLTVDEIIVNKTHGPRDGAIIDDKFVLVQHDMLLTKEQYQEIYGKKGELSKRAHAVKGSNYRWTNGVVPYEFASYSGNKNLVLQAMQEWQSKTCIRFRQRTSSDRHYITIQEGKGCNSQVGMMPFPGQKLNLEYPGCWTNSVILHELGHAIGLMHEQQHPNAGNYITVNYYNINQDCQQWWRPMSASTVDTYGLDYDMYSIMHYGVYDCSANGQPSITTKDRSKQNIPGSSKSLSPYSDIKIVNMMYNCGGTGGGCADSHAHCVYWAGVGECQRNAGYMLVNCKRSCNRC